MCAFCYGARATLWRMVKRGQYPHATGMIEARMMSESHPLREATSKSEPRGLTESHQESEPGERTRNNTFE